MIKGIAEFMLAALLRSSGLRSGPRKDAPSMVRLTRSLVSAGRPFAIGPAANENDAGGRRHTRVRPF